MWTGITVFILNSDEDERRHKILESLLDNLFICLFVCLREFGLSKTNLIFRKEKAKISYTE